MVPLCLSSTFDSSIFLFSTIRSTGNVMLILIGLYVERQEVYVIVELVMEQEWGSFVRLYMALACMRAIRGHGEIGVQIMEKEMDMLARRRLAFDWTVLTI